MNTGWQLKLVRLTVFMLFCAGLLTLVPEAQGYNLPQELTPQKVIATYSGPYPPDIFAFFRMCDWMTVEFRLEVWNVGSAGGTQYAEASLWEKVAKGQVYTDAEGRRICEFTGFIEFTSTGTFTGGPNGVAAIDMNGTPVDITGGPNGLSTTPVDIQFVDGQKAVFRTAFIWDCNDCPEGKSPTPSWGTFELTVENPEAFDATVSEPAGSECFPRVSNINDLKPGDTLSPRASFIDANGKPIDIIQHRWYINGVETDSVIWDGTETQLELQYTCPNHQGDVSIFTFPAYQEAPPAVNQSDSGEPDVEQPPESGPESTPGGLGPIAIAIGLGVITLGIAGVTGVAVLVIPKVFQRPPRTSLPASPKSPEPIPATPRPPIPKQFGGAEDNPNTAFDTRNIFCKGLPYPLVNTATLGLVVEDIVFRYKGLGAGIILKMTYNSGSRSPGMFGQGWRFAYESEIQEKNGVVEVWQGSGQVLTFRSATPVNPQSVYPIELIAPVGIYDRLYDYGQYLLYHEKDRLLSYIYNRNPNQPIAKLNTIRDLDGNATNVQYNADGYLTTLTDAAGRLTQFLYDSQGHCTSLKIPDGRSARYIYNSSGFLVQAVDLLGIVASYTYDQEGKMVALATDRDQRTNQFSYQNSHYGACIASVTNPNGGITRYEIVSEKPRQVRVTDPGGLTTQYSSHNGLTTQVVDPSGMSASYTYENNMLINMQNKNGHSYQFTYDTRGNQVRVVDPAGKIWQYSYNDLDLLTAETDPDGNTFQYAYNERGHPVKTLSPEGRTVTFTYDPHGLVCDVGMAGGEQIKLKHDAFGNVASLIDQAGNATRLDYDPSGLSLQATTDRRGNTTRFERDLNDRLTQISFPDGSKRQYTYNCWSGTGAVDENGNTWRYKWDGLLQLTEQTDAAGNSLLSVFDQSGRLARLIDPRSQTYGFQYDTAQREVRMTNPLGKIQVLQFDPQDNLVTLTDESGNISHYSYDAFNRLASTTNPDGGAVTLQRDSTGKVSAIRNARGQTIAYEYDRDGFVSRKTFDGKAAATYRIGVDAELTQITDSNGSTNFQYDAAGRVSQIQYPGKLKAGFTYDPNGNLVTIQYPDNQILRYSYDLRNRPIRVEWEQHFIACRYDPAGNLLGITRSNGVESAYTYNPNGLVTGVKHNRGEQILADIRYSLDAAGNLTSESGSYPLEPVATEPASKAVYNSANQLTSLNGQPYGYDADGNLVSIGNSWQANYDPENRMTELHRNGQTLTHTYDGNGRLSSVTKDRDTRHVYYDPFGRLLFETDGQNQVSQMNIYLGNRLAALVQPNGQVWFYHFNTQGSTLTLTNSDGEIAAAYSYNPYGACTSKAGSIIGNPFTFVGEFGVRDEGEGLYFMKNRHYDACSGRFLQQDPIGISGGSNLYAYTGGNPTSRIDPEGTFIWFIVEGIFVFVSASAVYYAAKGGESALEGYEASKRAYEKAEGTWTAPVTDLDQGQAYKVLPKLKNNLNSAGANVMGEAQNLVETTTKEVTEQLLTPYRAKGDLVLAIVEDTLERANASQTKDIGTPPPSQCPKSKKGMFFDL